MSRTTAHRPPAPDTPPETDPFRYGWRLVPRPTPDDPYNLEQVPLTLEDVLHPETGDFIVHSDRHATDRMELTAVLRARLEPAGVAVVLSDVRIAWDLPDLRPHGPETSGGSVRRLRGGGAAGGGSGGTGATGSGTRAAGGGSAGSGSAGAAGG